jgi:hypothetical protein
MQVYAIGYINVHLNLGRTKVIMRTAPLTETLSFLSCLNHLSRALPALCSGLRNRFILHPFCSNALIILLLSLQIVCIVEPTRQNSRHTSASFFIPPFYIALTSLIFASTLKTVTVGDGSHDINLPVSC